VVDAGAGRALPHLALEPFKRVAIAGRDDLHGAVVQVADRAGDPFSTRGVAHEEAESDALHAPRDQEPPSDEHERLIIAAVAADNWLVRAAGAFRGRRSSDGAHVFELGEWVQADRRRVSRRFTEALAVASELHAGQRRKGSDVPYIAHLLGVTSIAFEYGADEPTAIAALLHDAIEDAPRSLGAAGVRDLIRSRFGAEVLAIVEGCTDSDAHPKPPWRTRKLAYIDHVATIVPGALLVSASDKLHNVRAILTDFLQIGDAVWARFSPEAGKSGTIGYYRGLVEAFRARRADGPGRFARLVDDLDATLADLERHAGERGRWPPA